MHIKPMRIIPILLVLVLAAAGWWFFGRGQASSQVSEQPASGTIEATQVRAGAELGGRVAEVLAAEGETVTAGQVLVRLDGRLLQAQLDQARWAEAQARASYNLVAAGTPAEQRQAAVAAAQVEVAAAQKALDDLKNTAALAAARLNDEVARADKALDTAQQRLDSVRGSADPADIDAAQAAVTLAQDRLDKAEEDFEPYRKKPQENVTRAMFQSRLADAQKHYDATVTLLNNLQGKANQYELAIAEAGRQAAQAALDDARRRYEEAKDGPPPADLALAESRLAAAQARLAAAQAGPTREQLELAQTQVDSAAAAVKVLEVQVEKLTLLAPGPGVILARLVEPGEMVLAGAPLFTLSQLDRLTITIYLPEDRYGTVSLGQEAQVTVDSYPGETFTAVVDHIADQAEFTPRNVQTAEGRRTTVFAIRLSIQNPQGKLKPGMPADVRFNR